MTARDQTVYVIESTQRDVTTWVCICATREIAEKKLERFKALGTLEIREAWVATERDV